MPYFYEKADLASALSKIEHAMYTPLRPVSVEAWLTPEPVPYEARTTGDYRMLTLGQSWGKLWDCAWMRITGEVPPEAAGQPVVLLLDFNGEGCVFDDQGNPVLGLTTVNSLFERSLGFPGKKVVPILKSASGGE